MLAPEIRCVVGIAIAKTSHVICALEVPSGTVRQKAIRIDASAEGYAQLCTWVHAWGTPETVLIGLEATGVLWEPLYEALVQAGYSVVVLNPRQTSSWAESLGLRAKTDGIDAQTLARGLLAGYARASTLPSEAVQALRALTRTRRDLIQSRTAAGPRLQGELVVLFPELLRHLPRHSDLGTPAVLKLLSNYGSARAFAQTAPHDVAACMNEISHGQSEALALCSLALRSAASTRAVEARGLVVRTLALHLLDLHQRLAEVEAAITDLLKGDADGQHLLDVPGIGPQTAAMIRAELGDVMRFRGVDQVIASRGWTRAPAKVGLLWARSVSPSGDLAPYAMRCIWRRLWPWGLDWSGVNAISAYWDVGVPRRRR